MPLFTPNFLLPFPSPLDEPCDFAQQWCDFSNAVQTVIDGFQTIIDRTTPAIPLARLLVTEPVTIATGQEIPFDTLSVDTAGWVDFDADPSGIYVDRGGYFYFIANAQIATGGVVNTEYSLQINNVTDQDATIDNGVAGSVMGLNSAAIEVNNILTRYSATLTAITAATIVVNSAAFSVFWHSDEATP